MDSETIEPSNFNSNSSSTKRDQSMKHMPSEFWAAYYHHMATVNFPCQFGPLRLTDSHLHPNYLFFVPYTYHVAPNSSLPSFADISTLNAKDFEFRSDCDSLLNEYKTKGFPNNLCTLPKDKSDDCPQTITSYDHDVGKKQMAYRIEMTKVIKRCASPKIHPTKRPKIMDKCQTDNLNENEIEEIIAKELDYAISQAKIHRKHSHDHQEKQKIHSKSEKRSRNKLILSTEDRIKSSVFDCSPNPTDFQENKIYDLEAYQQPIQGHLFLQPEFFSQYQAYNTPEPLQYSLIWRPISQVNQDEPVNPQLACNNCLKSCTCKSSDTPLVIDCSSSPESNHSDEPFDKITKLNHSILEILSK